jgi:tetratricopeptide (TPR) repeat protein
MTTLRIVNRKSNKMKKWVLIVILLLPLAGCAAILQLDRNQYGAAESDSASIEATWRYSLGVLQALSGNLRGAIEEYRAAHAADPKSPIVAVELAALYLRGGQQSEALALCEASLVHNPNYVDLHLVLGSIYFERKEYQKADQAFRRAVALDPKALESYLYLSVIYGEQKKYSESVIILKDLLKIDPNNLIGHYYLAKRYADMKMYDESERWFKKTIALKPNFESAVVDLAALYEVMGRFDDEIKVFKTFLGRYPNRADMKLRMGKAYLRQKKYLESAQILEEILKIDPLNREVRLTMGIAYFFSGPAGHDRAIAELLQVLTINPFEHRARYFLAAAYEEKKRYGDALAEFGKIPDGSDLFVDARIHMAGLLKKEGKPDQSIKVLREALEKKKGDVGLSSFLASLYQDEKKFAEAESVLKEGLLFAPRSEELLYRLGVVYEAANRFEDSIQAMEGVLKIDPEHADALNFIGYSYADRGIHLQKAEEMVQKALRLKPGNGYITDSLGWVYFKQNKNDLAIKYLKEATAIMPDDPLIAEHLGDALAKKGAIEEAIEAYRRALKLNPKMDGVSAKIEKLLKKK